MQIKRKPTPPPGLYPVDLAEVGGRAGDESPPSAYSYRLPTPIASSSSVTSVTAADTAQTDIEIWQDEQPDVLEERVTAPLIDMASGMSTRMGLRSAAALDAG